MGIAKLYEALTLMVQSEFVKNNMSINAIFKTENFKKALIGAIGGLTLRIDTSNINSSSEKDKIIGHALYNSISSGRFKGGSDFDILVVNKNEHSIRI